MIYAYILVPILTLLLGGVGGYFLGRYQSTLIDKIRTLQAEQGTPKPDTPGVTLGTYTPPVVISNIPDKRAVGLVEPKTPERLAYEAANALEKEAQGA